MTSEFKKGLVGLGSGLIFGAGLVVSGMTNPEKVLAFLTLNSDWNPALIFVLGSAVLVASVGFYLAGKMGKPFFADIFSSPDRFNITQRLLLGSALFGVGWGLAGFCPGPALVGAMQLDIRALVFLFAFIVGALGYDRWLAPSVPTSKS